MTYIVTVQFPDRGRPFLMGLDIFQSGRQDLRLPANDYRVRVMRADTGAPIPKAQVGVVNTGAADEQTQGQTLETDDDGVAHAMPLRPGQVEITARARHFAPAEIMKEKVPDEDVSREITISLKPLEGDNLVALMLSTGAPAVGAEVWIRPDPTAPPLILPADESGKVSLPDAAAGAPMLVRAPGVASGFVVWDGEADTIRLGPAGPPLAVAVHKQNGDPGAWARLALWIDGIRYTGPVLQWAFNAQPPDANGFMTLVGLPPRPVEVLFWSPKQPTAGFADSGAFDSQRTTVAFPWPAFVTATMVE